MSPGPASLSWAIRKLRWALTHPREAVGRAARFPGSLATALLGRDSPGRVIVYHASRSGSTVLGSLLNQHPQIHWEREIFTRYFANRSVSDTCIENPAAAFAYLERRMSYARQKYYGFEFKFANLRHLGMSLEDVSARLASLDVSHQIILERRNYLRIVVSNLIGLQQGSFHARRGDDRGQQRARIDLYDLQLPGSRTSLIEFLTKVEKYFRTLGDLLDDRDVLHLTYEDDIASDPVRGYRRVCRYLGVPPDDDPEVIFRRTNPGRLDQLIENYAEVAEILRDTHFAWMLSAV